ncbi:hypothetical protein ACFQ8S_11900 [Streptomyces virginiae]
MRDERRVDRSPFTWDDTLFFDPFDVFHVTGTTRPRRSGAGRST